MNRLESYRSRASLRKIFLQYCGHLFESNFSLEAIKKILSDKTIMPVAEAYNSYYSI